MKSNEINSIIEESLLSEVKNRIINEQNMNGNVENIVKSFKSLSPLLDNIVGVKNITNENGFGALIYIQNTNESEMKNLSGNLHYDMERAGYFNCDVDVNVHELNGLINGEIKIKSLDKPGNEITENMKKIKKSVFLEALNKAKKDKKNKFVVEGVEFDLTKENWKIVNESDEELNEMPGEGVCYECGGTPTNVDEEEEEIDECAGPEMEEESVKKRTIKLKESELVNLIDKLVSESIPGLSTFEKARRESGKQNKEELSNVDKKLKAYLSFDGSNNPKFPNQNGLGDEKEGSYMNSTEEEEFIEDYRGGGMQDLNYDEKPSEEFIKRVKEAINGSSRMGNSSEVKETANTLQTKTGEKVFKNIKQKAEAKAKEPMYKKDIQPVDDKKAKVDDKVIKEEIARMKQMVSYNEKTQ